MKRKFPKDLTGIRFGRLTVVGPAPKRELNAYGEPCHTSYWWCKCDCGGDEYPRWSELPGYERGFRRIARSGLTSGQTKSCGCFQSEQASSKEKRAKISKGVKKYLKQKKNREEPKL